MPVNPDPSEMSDEQKAHFRDWLLEQWKGSKNCPICGVEQWEPSAHIFAAMTFQAGDTWTNGTTIYPFVAVYCRNCGFSHSFNAIAMAMPNLNLTVVEDGNAK